MGYGFPLHSATRIETLGVATGSGVAVTASGSGSGIYGSLATIGTTGFAYDGFMLQAQVYNARNWKVTITAATGGGADETIVQDFYFANSGATGSNSIDFPIRVPAGAVIKIKVAANFGSSVTYLAIIGYQGNHNLVRGFSRAVSLTDFGSNSVYPANAITLNGTTLTAWSELCASTSQAVEAIGLCFTGLASSFGTNLRISVELGYGGAGAENGTGIQVISACNGNTMNNDPILVPYFIPAGTRLAMRGQVSAAETHTCAVVAWGYQL